MTDAKDRENEWRVKGRVVSSWQRIREIWLREGIEEVWEEKKEIERDRKDKMQVYHAS